MSRIERLFRGVQDLALDLAARNQAITAPAAYLPTVMGVEPGLRGGRNIYEGYQRGFGLQFGSLTREIKRDPLYREAFRLAKGRTIVSEQNRMNIFLILRFFLHGAQPGHIVEFGSYKGGNAIFMAYVASKLFPDVRVYALDTFKGMPAVDKNVDAHNETDFGDVDLAELKRFTEQAGLFNLKFVPGLFEDTARAVLDEAGTVVLAHIDCDIRSAVAFAYESVRKRMSRGGYLIFDDANVSSCIGATQAVEDLVIRRDGKNSEQIYPHFVFREFPENTEAQPEMGRFPPDSPSITRVL